MGFRASVAVSGRGSGARFELFGRLFGRERRAREIIHRTRREIAHAFEVAERALALEAGAAGDVDLRDLRLR
jgi:hypothetical protein